MVYDTSKYSLDIQTNKHNCRAPSCTKSHQIPITFQQTNMAMAMENGPFIDNLPNVTYLKIWFSKAIVSLPEGNPIEITIYHY